MPTSFWSLLRHVELCRAADCDLSWPISFHRKAPWTRNLHRDAVQVANCWKLMEKWEISGSGSVLEKIAYPKRFFCFSALFKALTHCGCQVSGRDDPTSSIMGCSRGVKLRGQARVNCKDPFQLPSSHHSTWRKLPSQQTFCRSKQAFSKIV